jgi:hypothetical protein
MLIQKDIEAKMLSQIREACAAFDFLTVRGAWEEAFFGLTRWSEGEGNEDAFISVALGTPARNTPANPVATIAANVTVFVRCECDPRGEKLTLICETLQNLFDQWIQSDHLGESTALDIPEFFVGGVAMGGGNAPTLNNSVCSVTYPLELSGSYTN